MKLNTIYNEDCREGMNKIPDKSIDMIFCDPPFGTTKNSWDIIIPFEELWSHYERVIKDNGAIVLFAQAPFDKVLACSNLKLFRYEWIWEKELGTGFYNSEKMPMKCHENILVFYKKLPTYNPIKTKGHKKIVKLASKEKCIESSNYGKSFKRSDYSSDERYPRSVLRFTSDRKRSSNDEEEKHPTQKPVALCDYLIKTYTNEEEVVLDNCMGSWTTAVSCIRTNRNFIGFENGINDNTGTPFIEIAERRIKAAKGEVGLFSA